MQGVFFMSITIRDCLNLPSFSFGNVVAGKNGLDKIVSSVSVMEFFSLSDFDIFTPNELIISAFYAIKDDVEKQCEALKELADTGAIALVLFYVGAVIPEIDEKVINLADKLELPLIELRSENYSIKYSDIITDVMTAIIQDQNASQDFIDTTKKRLEQLPFEVRTMENLLNIISNHYKCNLLLTGASQLYFQSQYRPTYISGDSDFFYEQFHNAPTGYWEKTLMVQDKTVHIYKMDFSYASNIRMTMYASCHNTVLDENILHNMCNCTLFFSTLWGYSLDLSSPETLLSLIFKTETGAANRYLNAAGISFSRIANLIIVSPGGGDIQKLKAHLLAFFYDYKKYFLEDIIDNQIVILSAFDLTNSMDAALFEELWRYTDKFDPKATFFMNEGSKDIAALKRTYMDFRKSLPALYKIFQNRRNWDTHDIMLSQEIIALAETENKRTKYLSNLAEILKQDSDDLLTTLGVYMIDCDSKLNLTAQTLFLHRNTVTYRLNKVRQLTNTNFTLMPAAYDFYMALALWRYQKMDG